MDALEHLIRSEEAELERLRILIAAQEAKVAALREAASLRPAAASKRNGVGSPRSGKPKGAISAQWKDTLAALYSYQPKVWSYNDIKGCFDHVNKQNLNIASVRDRVRSLVDSGLMQGSAESGFEVTEGAARKYKFKKVEASGAATPEASNARGPEAESEGRQTAAQHPAANREGVGSNPTGSVPVHRQRPSFDDDLDDDVPF